MTEGDNDTNAQWENHFSMKTRRARLESAEFHKAVRAATQTAAPSDDNQLVRDAISSVTRTCDIVFGATASTIAIYATWLAATGHVYVSTVLATWSIVAVNVIWSVVARGRDIVMVDVTRGVVCLPIVAYLYVGEHGLLEKLWVPSLMMTVGVALTTGIASRRAAAGIGMTLLYAAGLLLISFAVWARIGVDLLADVVGVALTGTVTALVSSKLGRMLDEVQRQRDLAHQQQHRAEQTLAQLAERSQQLDAAVGDLNNEMDLRMRAESELRQAQKLEAVGRLASGIAHEINTPLQFVSDSIDFVRDSMAELLGTVDKLEAAQRAVLQDAPARQAAERAARSAAAIDLPYLKLNIPKALDRALDGLSRVTTIVRSMKEFAHPDTSQMESIDLNHAIETTLTIARNEYKQIAELETHLGELPPVRCHLGELNQAVLNIVVNAAHAIDEAVQGTSSTGKIRVETYCDGDDVVIAISDTGRGIPTEIQAKIFDPFFTTKPVGRGTGQGLAVAHSVIVDKHHGSIRFETEAGKGTTFFMRLPIEGARGVVPPEAFSADL